jgi:hypothetical protein
MNPARLSLALLLFSSGALFAKAPATYHYLPPDSVNVQSILSGPPAPGSPENEADINMVLAVQNARTQEKVARARSEEDLSPAAFANIIGTWFTPDNLPLTFALLDNAAADSENISNSAKDFWHRPRPPLQNHDIHPLFTLPTSPSYPSGHATRGALWSVILAKLAPDLSQPILTRGIQIGADRVIAGVHFPTDVAAGQKLGRTLAALLLQNPKFQRDLARAQSEFTHARPKTLSAIWKTPRPGLIIPPIRNLQSLLCPFHPASIRPLSDLYPTSIRPVSG